MHSFLSYGLSDEFDDFCPNYTFEQFGRAIYTATFAISGVTTVRRCCGNICVGEVLH